MHIDTDIEPRFALFGGQLLKEIQGSFVSLDVMEADIPLVFHGNL